MHAVIIAFRWLLGFSTRLYPFPRLPVGEHDMIQTDSPYKQPRLYLLLKLILIMIPR